MSKKYTLPEIGQPFDSEVFYLGKICKRNHIHTDGMTLRWVKNSQCCICSRIDAVERQRKKREDPELREKLNTYQAKYQAKSRARHGRPSRSKYGLPYRAHSDKGFTAMRCSIASAGRIPSVSMLVFEQQQEYWRDHPDERESYARSRNLARYHFRYMTEPGYRLYHRAKSKGRKVAQRGGTPSLLSDYQLLSHWEAFNNRCAYCGVIGNLQVEHVVPISKGGQHNLGNIVPACQSCNTDKLVLDAFEWFKSKPFYSKSRWRWIMEVLGKAQQEDV
jgi:5-methylcytosine-specific restriction endonuclease McrA